MAGSSSSAPKSAACRFQIVPAGQIVNFFTRTADNPKGSSIDDVFELPAEIRRIDVDANRWTVHQ